MTCVITLSWQYVLSRPPTLQKWSYNIWESITAILSWHRYLQRCVQPEVAIMSVMMLDPTDMTFISYSLFPISLQPIDGELIPGSRDCMFKVDGGMQSQQGES